MTSRDEQYLDESGDRNPVRAAILADPARRATYQAHLREDDLILAIRALREALGMTQVDLADAAHMSQENLSRIERSIDVKFSTIERLARAVDAQIELTAILKDGSRIELLRPRVPGPGSAAVSTPARSRPAPVAHRR